jgi:hypothetical protein
MARGRGSRREAELGDTVRVLMLDDRSSDGEGLEVVEEQPSIVSASSDDTKSVGEDDVEEEVDCVPKLQVVQPL